MLCVEDETKIIKEIELLGNVIDASNDHEEIMAKNDIDDVLKTVSFD